MGALRGPPAVRCRGGRRAPRRTPAGLYPTITEPLPVPTVEFAIHLAHPLHGRAVDDWVLASIHTEQAGDGWAVDDAALHTRQGILLATGRQTPRVLAPPVGTPATGGSQTGSTGN